jgi:hypothetical protein
MTARPASMDVDYIRFGITSRETRLTCFVMPMTWKWSVGLAVITVGSNRLMHCRSLRFEIDANLYGSGAFT